MIVLVYTSLLTNEIAIIYDFIENDVYFNDNDK